MFIDRRVELRDGATEGGLDICVGKCGHNLKACARLKVASLPNRGLPNRLDALIRMTWHTVGPKRQLRLVRPLQQRSRARSCSICGVIGPLGAVPIPQSSFVERVREPCRGSDA